jgi:hypothetical protein
MNGPRAGPAGAAPLAARAVSGYCVSTTITL